MTILDILSKLIVIVGLIVMVVAGIVFINYLLGG